MGTIQLEHRLASHFPSEGWGARRLYKSKALLQSERENTCSPSWFMRRMETIPPDEGAKRKEETMGYTIRPVAASAPPVVEVPAQVAEDLEGLWKYLQENPEYVASATFDTAEEVGVFDKQARCWAETREAGQLRFRKLYAGKDSPDTFLKFTIAPPLTDEEKAVIKARNDAAKAKRDAADKAKPKSK